ncbi:ribonuclease III [Mycoplasmopsis iners]|uniref:ribonuclease III n=1 Tax=Mycoplasmopsis iners TaxID=76630 RepID=UPI00049696D0|nr:ribonuclease III [Mycoplasmopsis iners]
MKFNSLKELLQHFNIFPNTYSFYREALTHVSHSNFKKNSLKDINSYETLEFLGDSILQFLVSNYLLKRFKHIGPGNLTLLRSKMVNTKNLNEISFNLDLRNFLFTAPGQMSLEVKKSEKVGADIFESLVAAIYLDQGIEKTNQFLKHTLFPSADKLIKENLKDAKTTFQEYIQSFSKHAVNYVTIQKDGVFESKVIHAENIFGKGSGKSKLEAEENAAKDALEKLQK